VSDDVKPNPEWEASMDQYRKQVEANPSVRRDPILQAHLDRIRLTHQKLLDARAACGSRVIGARTRHR
jgi:hypothetical protein